MSGKITGIGGIFIKVKEPEKTREWYRNFLGFDLDTYGCTFLPQHLSNGKGHMAFSFMPDNTPYFDPSHADFMLNFRVSDLENFIKDLQSKGVETLDEIAIYDYGKFIHILDCNGLKIELWEPADEQYESIISAKMPKD